MSDQVTPNGGITFRVEKAEDVSQSVLEIRIEAIQRQIASATSTLFTYKELQRRRNVSGEGQCAGGTDTDSWRRRRKSSSVQSVACITSLRRYLQGAPKKVIPEEKFDIFGIVADFFAKFSAFIEEYSSHIILRISLQ